MDDETAVDGSKKAPAAVEKLGNELRKLSTKAVTDGVGPMTGSAAYAEARLGSGDGARDPEAAIRRVIRESVAASGAQGFVTGVGGIAALPVTLPANMAGSLIINSRMVGAVAQLRGYNLDDPHTQAMIMMVAAGSSAQAAVSAFGVKVGQKAAMQVIEKLPMSVLHAINKKAGFYLVAKYGTSRSAVTLSKFVPGVGGLVGGAVDASLTASIGKVSKKVFPPL